MEFLHNITHSCKFHEMNERKSEQNLILILYTMRWSERSSKLFYLVMFKIMRTFKGVSMKSNPKTRPTMFACSEEKRDGGDPTDDQHLSLLWLIPFPSPRPIFLLAPLIKPLDCLSDTRENETLNVFNNSGHRYAMTVPNFLSFFPYRPFSFSSLLLFSRLRDPPCFHRRTWRRRRLSQPQTRGTRFSNKVIAYCLANVLPGTLRSFWGRAETPGRPRSHSCRRTEEGEYKKILECDFVGNELFLGASTSTVAANAWPALRLRWSTRWTRSARGPGAKPRSKRFFNCFHSTFSGKLRLWFF